MNINQGKSDKSEIIAKLEPQLELKLVLNGKVILDELKFKLLFLVDKYNSILTACKILGIPYSTAWDLISRIEAALGVKIVESKRVGKSIYYRIVNKKVGKILKIINHNFKSK